MKFSFLILLFAATSWAQVKPPQLPPELFTFDKLAQDVRSPLSLAMHNILLTFRRTEREPGHVLFYDKDRNIKLAIRFTRQLQAVDEKTKYRLETLRFEDPNGQLIVEEKVETHGSQDLQYSDPRDRILFQGDINYGLEPNEFFKKVTVSADGHEILRFESLKLQGDTERHYDAYFSKAKVLSIIDLQSEDKAYRRVSYDMVGKYYFIKAFNDVVERGWGRPKNHTVELVKPQEALIENLKYRVDGERVFSLSNFMSKFNSNIYDPMIVKGAGKIMDAIVSSRFPRISGKLDLTRQERLLDEFQALLGIIEQAKTNAGLLNKISAQIKSYVEAIRLGTLKITDTRPKGQ